ncbi:MAG: biotin transporter BioY, partial [Halanaerobiales bacterium]
MNKQKKKITDIRSINLMALFAALTAIGAFIRIPLPYVPITLQTIFVLLAGVLLGKKRAALSQVIYLV